MGALIAIIWLMPAHTESQGSPAVRRSTDEADRWRPSRTPDGQPDLQGIWSFATITPLERPDALAGREFLTETEVAAANEEAATRGDRRGATPDADVTAAYNAFWWDRGKSTGRTSLIVDPSNGKVPPLIPEAQRREGVEVSTSSARAEHSRRTILEMLASAVDLSQAPEIQKLMDENHADPARFPDAERREYPVLDDNPMYIRDYSKCILCWRCVQVCADDAQFTYAINFKGRGFDTGIGTFFDKPMPETTCVFCGQCVGVCPTGALKPKRESLLEQGFSLDEIMQATRGGKKRRRKSP